MSPQLKGFAPDNIGNLDTPDLLPYFDEIAVLEHRKDGDNTYADNKTEYDFFLQRHGIAFRNRQDVFSDRYTILVCVYLKF